MYRPVLLVAGLLLAACEPQRPAAMSGPATPSLAASASSLLPATLSADEPGAVAPKDLSIPVRGVPRSALRDMFDERRGQAPHEAIDIPAPRGTPVVAVADGRVVKLFNSRPGGLTVYQFDVTDRFAYYYAHLDGYAPGLAEGQLLRRGDPVGQVGSTGNASPEAPHLHFAVFRLEPEKQWWKGTAINPYPLLTVESP